MVIDGILYIYKYGHKKLYVMSFIFSLWFINYEEHCKR